MRQKFKPLYCLGFKYLFENSFSLLLKTVLPNALYQLGIQGWCKVSKDTMLQLSHAYCITLKTLFTFCNVIL